MTPFFKANNLFSIKGGALVTNKSSVLNGPLHHCFVSDEKKTLYQKVFFLCVFIIFFKEWNVRRLTSFVSTNSVGRNFHE